MDIVDTNVRSTPIPAPSDPPHQFRAAAHHRSAPGIPAACSPRGSREIARIAEKFGAPPMLVLIAKRAA